MKQKHSPCEALLLKAFPGGPANQIMTNLISEDKTRGRLVTCQPVLPFSLQLEWKTTSFHGNQFQPIPSPFFAANRHTGYIIVNSGNLETALKEVVLQLPVGVSVSPKPTPKKPLKPGESEGPQVLGRQVPLVSRLLNVTLDNTAWGGAGRGRSEGEREKKARGKEEIDAAVEETLDKTNMEIKQDR